MSLSCCLLDLEYTLDTQILELQTLQRSYIAYDSYSAEMKALLILMKKTQCKITSLNIKQLRDKICRSQMEGSPLR